MTLLAEAVYETRWRCPCIYNSICPPSNSSITTVTSLTGCPSTLTLMTWLPTSEALNWHLKMPLLFSVRVNGTVRLDGPGKAREAPCQHQWRNNLHCRTGVEREGWVGVRTSDQMRIQWNKKKQQTVVHTQYLHIWSYAIVWLIYRWRPGEEEMTKKATKKIIDRQATALIVWKGKELDK